MTHLGLTLPRRFLFETSQERVLFAWTFPQNGTVASFIQGRSVPVSTSPGDVEVEVRKTKEHSVRTPKSNTNL